MATFSLELPEGEEAEFDNACCAECIGITETQFEWALKNTIKVNSEEPSIGEIKTFIIENCK